MATLPDDVARKAVDDIRHGGAAYIRIDREGRAHHVPCYLVVDAAPAVDLGEWRTFE